MTFLLLLFIIACVFALALLIVPGIINLALRAWLTLIERGDSHE